MEQRSLPPATPSGSRKRALPQLTGAALSNRRHSSRSKTPLRDSLEHRLKYVPDGEICFPRTWLTRPASTTTALAGCTTLRRAAPRRPAPPPPLPATQPRVPPRPICGSHRSRWSVAALREGVGGSRPCGVPRWPVSRLGSGACTVTRCLLIAPRQSHSTSIPPPLHWPLYFYLTLPYLDSTDIHNALLLDALTRNHLCALL